MALVWTPEGPRPTTRGQVEGIVDGEVVGAVKAVAAHPTDPDIVYVGAVNGGVWRTRNARDARPTWEQLTDAQQSLSLGALELDPTDSATRTLVAGTGRFSSLSRIGGALIGVLRTTDGGATWTTLDGDGQLRGLHICDVASRGQTIVVAANAGVLPYDRCGHVLDAGFRQSRNGAAGGHLVRAGWRPDKAPSPVRACRHRRYLQEQRYRGDLEQGEQRRDRRPAPRRRQREDLGRRQQQRVRGDRRCQEGSPACSAPATAAAPGRRSTCPPPSRPAELASACIRAVRPASICPWPPIARTTGWSTSAATASRHSTKGAAATGAVSQQHRRATIPGDSSASMRRGRAAARSRTSRTRTRRPTPRPTPIRAAWRSMPRAT